MSALLKNELAMLRPPAMQFDSKDTATAYSVSCLGGSDWSLKELYETAKTGLNDELTDRIGFELAGRGVRNGYAPSVAAMSGAVVTADQLDTCIELPYGPDLYRNRALPSDGLPLAEPGDAFVGSFGGCAVLVAEGDGVLIAAHAGRDSLLDTGMILDGEQSRPHMSVIDAMAAASWEQYRVMPDRLTLRCFFAIRTTYFSHKLDDPRHDGLNRKRAAFIRDTYGEGVQHINGDTGVIDLVALIHVQARRARMRVARTEGFERIPEGNDFGHTRHTQPGLKHQRNLVIVQRLS